MKPIFIALLLAPTMALACMPKGDRLTTTEKKAFAAEFNLLSGRCAKAVAKQIGNLKGDDTYVYELAQNNQVNYTVIGKMTIGITKTKVMGKIQYTCGEITGNKRCM